MEEMSDIARQSLESIFNRPVTQQEYLYLLSRYPFIELCNHENNYLDLSTPPQVIVADNGWYIFDYGNALFASGNEYLNASYRKRKEEETGEAQGGHGTIVQQFSDIAFLLIDMIEARAWGGIDFLTGYYPMLRMAWIAAELKSLEYYYFEPSVEDYVVYNWVSKIKKKTFYTPDKTKVFKVKSAIKK
jgi:hypothetical protein